MASSIFVLQAAVLAARAVAAFASIFDFVLEAARRMAAWPAGMRRSTKRSVSAVDRAVVCCVMTHTPDFQPAGRQGVFITNRRGIPPPPSPPPGWGPRGVFLHGRRG